VLLEENQTRRQIHNSIQHSEDSPRPALGTGGQGAPQGSPVHLTLEEGARAWPGAEATQAEPAPRWSQHGAEGAH
jgi:hypothetical protein